MGEKCPLPTKINPCPCVLIPRAVHLPLLSGDLKSSVIIPFSHLQAFNLQTFSIQSVNKNCFSHVLSCVSLPCLDPKFLFLLTTKCFPERFTWHSLLCFLLILCLLPLPPTPGPLTNSAVWFDLHFSSHGESYGSTFFVSQMHHLFSFLLPLSIPHFSTELPKCLKTHLPVISNKSNQSSRLMSEPLKMKV